MSNIQTEDQLLRTTLETHGPASRVTLEKIKDAVDAYVGMNFITKKATQEEIKKSFDLLHRIYTTTLSAPLEHAIPAVQYLIRRIDQDRLGAFHPMRVNMTPNLEKGGSKTSLRYVADLNQLFSNLALVVNARELRSRIRIEPILANVRAADQRETIRQYIASIDH